MTCFVEDSSEIVRCSLTRVIDCCKSWTLCCFSHPVLWEAWSRENRAFDRSFV